jgi:Resolvase, N terminal domain
VAKLDRLSRSLRDFAELMSRAQAQRWNLVALDLGIDLSTASGEFMANVMASAAPWERRIIGQRTKDALAVQRSQGVRLGRPVVLSDQIGRPSVRIRQFPLARMTPRNTPRGGHNPDGGQDTALNSRVRGDSGRDGQATAVGIIWSLKVQNEGSD